MTTTALVTDLLKALIKEDFPTYDRLCGELDRQGWEGSGLLVGAAFYVAVGRRFSPGQNVGDIITFVARTRAQFDETGRDIDQSAAEALIRSALGETGLMSGVDSHTIVSTELLLTYALLAPLQMSDAALNAFLDEATELAQEWGRGE